MRERYSEITKQILLTLAMAGLIMIASTSPYFLTNLVKAIIKDKKYNKKAADSLKRLKNKRLIIIKEKSDGKFIVKLTREGERKVEEIQLDNMKIKKPQAWDKKWRMVIFDIPEKYKKNARDALREKLQKLNFYQFQKSVWVCPYPCEKEIYFLCELFDISRFVDVIVAEKIYNDSKLKRHFQLM